LTDKFNAKKLAVIASGNVWMCRPTDGVKCTFATTVASTFYRSSNMDIRILPMVPITGSRPNGVIFWCHWRYMQNNSTFSCWLDSQLCGGQYGNPNCIISRKQPK